MANTPDLYQRILVFLYEMYVPKNGGPNILGYDKNGEKRTLHAFNMMVNAWHIASETDGRLNPAYAATRVGGHDIGRYDPATALNKRAHEVVGHAFWVGLDLKDLAVSALLHPFPAVDFISNDFSLAGTFFGDADAQARTSIILHNYKWTAYDNIAVMLDNLTSDNRNGTIENRVREFLTRFGPEKVDTAKFAAIRQMISEFETAYHTRDIYQIIGAGDDAVAANKSATELKAGDVSNKSEAPAAAPYSKEFITDQFTEIVMKRNLPRAFEEVRNRISGPNIFDYQTLTDDRCH